MLFNSYVFVLFFLPITLAGFYIISGQFGYRGSRYWLISASLLFYAWWNPIYIWLLLASVTTNFCFSRLLQEKFIHRKKILVVGIAANLALLGCQLPEFFSYV